ncbi:MAG: DUF4136 domain-containing protein [Tannerellaceae bacterium]|jgi:hypothetical protein|nr:DUF4136 domain-containing protein [Tannerellaceae bacterium]
MRQPILYALITLTLCAGNVKGQYPSVCRLGFEYDISQSASWGYGKPVVTEIYPSSDAIEAGLKAGDIIETIDGVSVEGQDAAMIAGLLNPDGGKNSVLLTVTNLNDTSKPLHIRRDCKPTDAITEDRLAAAFAMYSLETTSERGFVCPFVTTTPDTADFAQFKTYAFPPADESNRRLEEVINECIGKELAAKGLSPDTVAPHMIVETFYFLKRNPSYKASAQTEGRRMTTYRYDCAQGQMEKFPFFNYAAPEADAEYLLQLGIRMIDNRDKRRRVIWECESNEMMSAAFRLENYARTHIPLMCMQYPYVRRNRNVRFTVTRKEYNYTGLNYDIDRLGRIMRVDAGSPARMSGLRENDVVETIDNLSMSGSAEEFTAAYKQFILNTMSMRDRETVFTDVNGFGYCMYWDKLKYTQVADAIRAPRNRAVFAYLYKYAPYVNPSGVNILTFGIRRGREKTDIMVSPSIRAEETITIQ